MIVKQKIHEGDEMLIALGVLLIFLTGYLLYALINPEKF
ncbi:MAG: K(+)-transporting ATPase subunit F [Carnobacterium sp.]